MWGWGFVGTTYWPGLARGDPEAGSLWGHSPGFSRGTAGSRLHVGLGVTRVGVTWGGLEQWGGHGP